MNRLTKRTAGGAANYDYPPDCYFDNGCMDAIAKSAFQQNCVERLAAYEDSMLSPEQVMFAKSIIESAEIERVRELLKAYKEGRVAVLPCKVGDEFWQIGDDFYALRIKYFSTYHGRTVVNADMRMLQPDSIDSFKYISREEVGLDE